jgi:hypothetical protein
VGRIWNGEKEEGKNGGKEGGMVPKRRMPRGGNMGERRESKMRSRAKLREGRGREKKNGQGTKKMRR